jgi:hypothetical protein
MRKHGKKGREERQVNKQHAFIITKIKAAQMSSFYFTS